MFRKYFIAGSIAALAATSVIPASAQGIEIGPDGIRLQEPDRGRDRDRDRDRRDVRAEVSEREAVRIARGEGVREVDGVSRTRSSYRVVGLDRRGDDIRVDVDRRSGEVLSVR